MNIRGHFWGQAPLTETLPAKDDDIRRRLEPLASDGKPS